MVAIYQSILRTQLRGVSRESQNTPVVLGAMRFHVKWYNRGNMTAGLLSSLVEGNKIYFLLHAIKVGDA